MSRHEHHDIAWSPKHGGCLAWRDEDGEDCCFECEGYYPTAESATAAVEGYRATWRSWAGMPVAGQSMR